MSYNTDATAEEVIIHKLRQILEVTLCT